MAGFGLSLQVHYNLKMNFIQLVGKNMMKKNLPQAQTTSIVIWAHFLPAFGALAGMGDAVVGGGGGGGGRLMVVGGRWHHRW